MKKKLLIGSVIVLAGLAIWKYQGIQNRVVQPVMNVLNGNTANVQQMFIEIDSVSLEKIKTKRDSAIAHGVLIKKKGDYVPAIIYLNQDTFHVQLRLKGDRPDHFAGEKWSFRIKSPSAEKAPFGYSKFSIHDPKTRNMLDEWVFHQMLKAEGQPYLDYFFISVHLNGESKGIFAVEEHFRAELLEKCKLPIGPIVAFSEAEAWQEDTLFNMQDPSLYLSAKTRAFKLYPGEIDSAFALLEAEAMEKLRAFQQGEIPASKAFDLEALGTFLAVSDVLGAYHANTWKNKRFYYHPETKLFTHIGFDAMSGVFPDSLIMFNAELNRAHMDTLLQGNFLVYPTYGKSMKKLTEDNYLQQFFSFHEKQIKQWEATLQIDDPAYRFDETRFFESLARSEDQFFGIFRDIKDIRWEPPEKQ